MRIVFTGDFMRPSAATWRPTQHHNIRWLHDLFVDPLRSLGAGPVSYVAWEADEVRRGGLDGDEVRRLYGLLDLAPGIDGWAALHGRRLLPSGFRNRVACLFRDALVIGFELPPYLKHCLAQEGRPYLDVNIHPVRFHDDLFLAVQASTRAADRVLEAHALDEDELALAAGVVRATARRLSRVAIEPGTELLLLQTRHDRTQIRDGRFIGIMDLLAQARADGLFAGPVLVRPHPLEPSNPHGRGILAALPCRAAPKAGIYELITHEAVARVVSLSSSTSVEARYFGREAVFLHREPFRLSYRGAGRPAGIDGYVSVKDAYFSLGFWADLLEAFGAAPAARIGRTAALAPKPNRLRTALKSFWGFNEVDTDIAAALFERP